MQRNITDILSEWFYRLPNGYATEPYSDLELQVLEKILAENGLKSTPIIQRMQGILNEVDQLDQAFLDAKPVKDLEEGRPKGGPAAGMAGEGLVLDLFEEETVITFTEDVGDIKKGIKYSVITSEQTGNEKGISAFSSRPGNAKIDVDVQVAALNESVNDPINLGISVKENNYAFIQNHIDAKKFEFFMKNEIVDKDFQKEFVDMVKTSVVRINKEKPGFFDKVKGNIEVFFALTKTANLVNKSNKTYYVEFDLDNPKHVEMISQFITGQGVVRDARPANYIALVDTGKKSAWINVSPNVKGTKNIPVELFTTPEYIKHVKENEGQTFVLMFRTYYKAKNNFTKLFGLSESLNEGSLDFLKTIYNKIKQKTTDVMYGLYKFFDNIFHIGEIEVLSTGGESIESVKNQLQTDIKLDLSDTITLQSSEEEPPGTA